MATVHGQIRENRAEMVSTIRGMAGDLKPFVSETMPILEKRADFKRAFETFLRIESAHRSGTHPTLDREEIRRDYAALVQGHILRARGLSYQEIDQRLGDERVAMWIKREQIPFSMYRDDPTRNAHFIKRMRIPEGVSTDFAYVLGAYAGTRFPSSETAGVRIQSSSAALIETLCERVTASCGIDVQVSVLHLGQQTYHSATSRAHEFAEYLDRVSRGNTAVPWTHLQTSAERREFLRGLLDFGGGSVDVEKGRFSISRHGNARLLEEVAVILKREGVNSRLRTSSATTLFVDATVELLAFAALDVIQRPELTQRLKAVCERPSSRQLVSATDYDAVIETARRLRTSGGVSAAAVSAALVASSHPCRDLPPSTIRHWLSGGFEPPSAKRRREVEGLERKHSTPERVAEIGQAILGRLPTAPHPYVVVGAIAEFFGGQRPLAALARVEPEAVRLALQHERIPSETTYRAILRIVGLEDNSRIETGARCPDGESIRNLFSKPAEQALFSLYRAAIMLRVKEAFERGLDIESAAQEALRRASERSSRVNRLD